MPSLILLLTGQGADMPVVGPVRPSRRVGDRVPVLACLDVHAGVVAGQE
jgi:hypothetical protein